MAVNARAKGMRGEYEVIRLLKPTVDKVYAELGLAVVNLERNILQTRAGGYDIVGLDWLALEVKRVEKTTHDKSGILGWWEQCRRQAGAEQEPVLFYRPNVTQWLIRMYGYLCIGPNGGPRVRTVVTVDLPSFLVWFEIRLRHELQKVKP